ncbi:MAG: hypothetical protein AUJ98_05190, partial [Bacteroidetes bacterium CG2_30_33_31]
MKNEIIIYQNEVSSTKIEVRLEEETVWLTIDQISGLFQRDRSVISRHINNIFKEGELNRELVCAFFAHTTQHGAIPGKTQTNNVEHFNLDVIISVGYRVKSQRGTQFRIWANQVLKDYLLKGYAISQRVDRIENDLHSVKSELGQIKLQLNTSLPTGGVFYDGEVFDAYALISKIIKSAKKSLILIDNYIDESVLTLLTKRQNYVSATIFTKSLSKQLELDLKKHNQQYPNNPNGNGILPFAVTKHYDPLNQNNEFTTIMISDGLGRPVQTKQSALIDDNGSKVPKWIVSGKQIYDAYGRVIESYQPTVDLLSNSTIISTTTSSINPTRVYYDALDRTTKVKMPDNTENLMEYGFGNDAFGLLTFMNQVTDANGVSIKSFTNAQGKQTTIKAPHYATTKFIYSPLGELIESIDPENYSTTYSYDLAGQLVSRSHPDAGTTSYTYDNAGNLLTTQTANLAGLSEFIQYSYDYNRLTQVTYPQNPENNVYYEYGTTGNESGRITKVQDASTIQQFSYGNLGEVTENIRTFVVPGGTNYTFAMNFEYDSWNRIKNMTYPDGEVVDYDYDIAGQLISVIGEKGTNTYRY